MAQVGRILILGGGIGGLSAALAARVPEASVHTGQRVLSVAPRDDGASLHFKNGRVESGALVVGADGLHSIARASVVNDGRLRYSGQTCFRGVARMVAEEPA